MCSMIECALHYIRHVCGLRADRNNNGIFIVHPHPLLHYIKIWRVLLVIANIDDDTTGAILLAAIFFNLLIEGNSMLYSYNNNNYGE